MKLTEIGEFREGFAGRAGAGRADADAILAEPRRPFGANGLGSSTPAASRPSASRRSGRRDPKLSLRPFRHLGVLDIAWAFPGMRAAIPAWRPFRARVAPPRAGR